MISKKYYQELLSDTAFKRDYSKTENDLFNYIVESEINGAISQFRELINKLSTQQFKDFLGFVDDFVFLNDNLQEQRDFKNKVIEARGNI